MREYIVDIVILLASIITAVILSSAGILSDAITAAEHIAFLGPFVAGLFFTSLFTVIPATVVFAELAGKGDSIITLAVVGGIGAMVGDFLLFLLLREAVAEPLLALARSGSTEGLKRMFRRRRHRFIGTLVGAIIIASPLPDEAGLLLMGLSRAPWYITLLVGFTLNAVGIAMVSLTAVALRS